MPGPGPAAGAAPVPPQTTPPYEPTRTVAAPESGRLIGGRYRLTARLGHGGMGTVWKARDEVVDRDVAVKEPRIPDQLLEHERQTVYQRMRREARAAAAIDHPSVVTVHDVVVEDGRPWIVMELLRGSSLGDRLSEGTLDPREAARIGLDVLGALAAAHEAGVLHRDVKPDNVLLGRYERVVLTDFGIAQVEGEQRLTETGGFVGSPEYIAPERVLGQLPGPESDLWSLGVLLYTAVEGVSPFRRANTPATLQAVLSAEPAAPARGAGALGHLIMQLLRKDPAARPGVTEIRRALENVARPPQPPASLLATRAMATGGGTGSHALRVLRTSRKARFGLGGFVVAGLVIGLLMEFANPFAGNGPPDGWVVREEGEVVKASLAVPKDYRRTVATDEAKVSFADPSGVFSVTLWRVEDAEETEPLDQEAKSWVDWYKSGAQNSMQDVSSKVRKSVQQDRPAADVVTTYRDYGAEETATIRHQIDHLYVNDEDTVYWRLLVQMPAEGEARADGEKLFEEIVEHLSIQEL